MDRVQRAKEIISGIRYITLATSSLDAQPWSTPVHVAFDDQYNFYWTSFKSTRHSQNIAANPRIHVSIVDPVAPHGEGDGVYIQANAAEITDIQEIECAAVIVYSAKGRSAKSPEEFSGDSERRMYKGTPEKFWISINAEVKIDPKNSKKEISML